MAAAVATKAAPAAAPIPSSHFSKLLRRSQFASFDPAIRQTYSSPNQHVHRGQWGLKRSINVKRKGAFISLPAAFEDPAFYIEWSHAENQVRFVRRFEEMQIKPRLNADSQWHKNLGSKNRSDWLMDSEFSSWEEGPEPFEWLNPEEEREKTEREVKLNPPSIQFDLAGLGEAGKGEYGSRSNRLATLGKHYYVNKNVTPNIYRMTDKQFQAYLAKLRELRGEFQQFTREQAQKLAKRQAEKKRLDDAHNPLMKPLYAIAQDSLQPHHREFISKHYMNKFRSLDSMTIEPRPHENGGLVYSHHSRLHTHFYAKYQPGIVLHPFNPLGDPVKANNARPLDGKPPGNYHVASFGGLTARVPDKQLEPNSHKVLLDLKTEKGLVRENLRASIAPMRLNPYGGAALSVPPRVVGKRPEGLKGVLMQTEVEIEGARHYQDNPFFPGTTMYSIMVPPGTKAKRYDSEMVVAPRPTPRTSRSASNLGRTKRSQSSEQVIISQLRSMLNTKPENTGL